MACRREEEPSGSRCRQSKPLPKIPFSHFFKIIVASTLEDKKLMIPNEFASKFGEELSDFAKLVVPNGHAWQLRLTKAHNNIWFDDGWQEFVEHHSISYGHLLVFRYKGSSSFSVLIFDMTACEIQYPCAGPNTSQGEKCPLHQDAATEEDDSILGSAIPYPHCSFKGRVFEESESKGKSSEHGKRVDFQESPNFEHFNETRSKICIQEKHHKTTDLDDADELRRGKLKYHGISSLYGPLSNEKMGNNFGDGMFQPKDEDDIHIFASGFAKATQENERVIQAARMLKPKNPSFMVLMRPYNICYNCVYVPAGFARRYLSEVSPCTIKLQVSDGREWPVRVIRKDGGQRRLTLAAGRKIFSSENNLVVGDICVFEMIKDNKILKVSIFRAVEHTGPSN